MLTLYKSDDNNNAHKTRKKGDIDHDLQYV
jgi:hypothetical protein